MKCCLNPDCPKPHNPDGTIYCQNCGVKILPLLRNRYRVTQLLSDEGGFGRTYLAEDEDKLNEVCVVKQLAPKTQGTWALNKATELFQQEARRLHELGEHPQIPSLFAHFEDNNHLYLVQQFIDGQNLSKELEQQRTYGEKQIRDILLDLLPVLEFVHQRGVIHRDIKPPNIIRRKSDGKLVLIDFGASKPLTATVINKTGTRIGSYGYSPLEQFQGGEAYPASDLFSLGATCFHLLTRTDPSNLWAEYGYSWVANWQQYLKSPISNELAKVLDKLLKKDFQQRYQSASEVLKDCQPVVSKPVVIQPGARGAIPNTPIPPTVIPQPGVRGAIPNPSTSIEASLVYTLQGHSSSVHSVAFSPDGQVLASGSSDNTIKLWNPVTGKEIRTLKGHSSSVHSVAFSPDGQVLASGSSDNTIKLWNPVTGKEIRTLKGHSSSVHSVAFSPDGQVLAGSSDNTIKLWNPATGQEIRTLEGHSGLVTSVTFSPDGQVLASGCYHGTIKLWNPATGQEICTLKGDSKSVLSIAFSPDGQVIASGTYDGTIKLWNPATRKEIRTLSAFLSSLFNQVTVDLTTGKEIRTLSGHSHHVNSVTFSPNGQVLASGSSDNTIKLWNPVTGKEIRTLKGHSKWVSSVAFSPDGQVLASGTFEGPNSDWYRFHCVLLLFKTQRA